MSKDDFRGPVFKPLKEDVDFQATFKKHFREELVVVPPDAASALEVKTINEPDLSLSSSDK